jgi:hypothetical protein
LPRGVFTRGRELPSHLLKHYFNRFISIINAIREKGASSGGGRRAGNFWVPAVSLQMFSMNLLKNLPTYMFIILKRSEESRLSSQLLAI